MVSIHDGRSADFAMYLPNAQSVEIRGSFTGWHDRPIPMSRTSDGWWTATVLLPAGDHEFQYFVDHRQWIPDYAAGGLRMSQFGSWVSLLHVPGEQAGVMRLAA